MGDKAVGTEDIPLVTGVTSAVEQVISPVKTGISCVLLVTGPVGVGAMRVTLK
jgi:hypothetical protein